MSEAITAKPIAWTIPMARAVPAVDFQTALYTAEAVIDTAVSVYESSDDARPVFFLFGPSLFASVEPARVGPGLFDTHYARYPSDGMAAVVARLIAAGYKDFTHALRVP